MSDRLTQLQILFDQLVEQFCATLNYVDKNHDSVPTVVGDEKMIDKQLPPPPSPQEFSSSINELSNDIVLKVRQILTSIELLPGIGVSTENQLTKIVELQNELNQIEVQRVQKMKEKDELLEWCNDLILDVANGIAESRYQ